MKKMLFVFGFAIMLIIGIAVADEILKTEINEGKSKVCLNYSLGYASDLSKAYEQIETITYKEGNQTIGYVNILGGIGKDFFIEANKDYEITASKNLTIYTR